MKLLAKLNFKALKLVDILFREDSLAVFYIWGNNKSFPGHIYEQLKYKLAFSRSNDCADLVIQDFLKHFPTYSFLVQDIIEIQFPRFTPVLQKYLLLK